jgi:5-methylcytosine-specific restriction endonuclease McrA
MALRDSPERLAALAEYNEAHRAWRKARPRIEYDHIIPFSEGGLTLVENMRVLCRKCHKSRTALWRAEKAARRRLEKVKNRT